MWVKFTPTSGSVYEYNPIYMIPELIQYRLIYIEGSNIKSACDLFYNRFGACNFEIDTQTGAVCFGLPTVKVRLAKVLPLNMKDVLVISKEDTTDNRDVLKNAVKDIPPTTLPEIVKKALCTLTIKELQGLKQLVDDSIRSKND